MACPDGVNLIVKPISGDLATGTHTLTVDADGTVTTCTFTYPPAILSSGGLEIIQCPIGLNVTIAPLQSCVEEKRRESTTLTCKPIPNSNQERIFVTGTPKTISVTQSVDETVILDESLVPTYLESEPNGRGCGICKQSQAEWILP